MLQSRSSLIPRNEKLGRTRRSSGGAVAGVAPHARPFEQKRRLLVLVYKLVLQTGQIKMPIYRHTNESDSEVPFLLSTLSALWSLLQRALEQNSN